MGLAPVSCTRPIIVLNKHYHKRQTRQFHTVKKHFHQVKQKSHVLKGGTQFVIDRWHKVRFMLRNIKSWTFQLSSQNEDVKLSVGKIKVQQLGHWCCVGSGGV